MEKPLRVAVFSDSFLPILNGVSVSIDTLVRELRNRGHSVHVYTASSPFYKDPDPNTYRFPAIEVPVWKQYPLAYPPFLGMLRKFRRHEYDLVHTHTPFTIGFVGLRWAESHRLPIISTYHTLYDRYAHYIRFMPKRYIRFKIAKHTNFYYNNVDHVITPSEASMKWLSRHSVSTDITVIPTAAPTGRMIDRAEVRRTLGIPAEQKMLLYVGRLAREKNMAVLFEAAAHAMRQDPNLRLYLVGDGPFRGECTSIVRTLGIGDRVKFVGFIPRAEVDAYYSAADLFVFSSITETQGLVIQEAMAYGIPAIAVAGGGASERIVDGENGFIVRNDPKPFGARILSVINDDSLMARLSEGAVESVRVHGTEAMTDQVLAVYHKVLGQMRESEPSPATRRKMVRASEDCGGGQ